MSDHVTKRMKAKRARRERAHLRVRKRVRGQRRAAAPVGLQEPALHLRAGHRRRARA